MQIKYIIIILEICSKIGFEFNVSSFEHGIFSGRLESILSTA